MSRIAIITGASSGIGRHFAETAAQHIQFDELWVVARRQSLLDELAAALPAVKVRTIAMDLTQRSQIAAIGSMLQSEQAQVVLLVNAAGFGTFQAVADVPQTTADRMLDLNCGALMDMCYTCLPYMQQGAKILNIASEAAFQPIPYMAEYGATKAFVLSFSRALWRELKPQGITVTALCPYWTKTAFFDVARTGGSQDRVHYFNAMYRVEDIVARGWRELLRGSDIATYGIVARMQTLMVKLLPHRWVMSIWCFQQRPKR